MEKAAADPEKYSRVVPLPNHGQIDKSLVGRKIELGWMTPLKEGEEGEPYVHVYEGEIVEVREQAADSKVRSVHGCRTKWAVAKVKWDAIFGEDDTWHPLNPDLYERQDGDKPKHLGWTLLNQEYLNFCARVERSITQQLGPAQKRK